MLAFKLKGAGEKNPFHIPGGGIDNNETPLEAVVREIEEESGLAGLEPTRYIGKWIREEPKQLAQRHYFLFEVPSTLPEQWDHIVTGSGEDAGVMYQFRWLLPHQALRLHRIYHAYLNAKHLPKFFPDNFFLGLNDETIYLTPYSERWPYIFAAEADILKQVLGNENVALIEHIGSTAIWDMPAKPIIDIAVGVNDVTIVDRVIAPMEQIGYTFKGPHGIPGRHYFTKSNANQTLFHLHLFHKESRNLYRHIKVRNALNRSSRLADTYAFIKLQLWAQNLNDRKNYQAGKVDFFRKFHQD